MSKNIPKVVVESPYSGDIKRNVDYAIQCMHDSLRRGEAPFLSHLLYTRELEGHVEDKPRKRAESMDAAFQWTDVCDYVVVYTDYGISEGMTEGIARAMKAKKVVSFRQLFDSE